MTKLIIKACVYGAFALNAVSSLSFIVAILSTITPILGMGILGWMGVSIGSTVAGVGLLFVPAVIRKLGK